MSDLTQLQIIKKGVKQWNEWRSKNPDIKPDLSEAQLEGAQLAGAHLRDVNLSRAKLDKASLQNADMSRAMLIGASAKGGDLFSANLRIASLENADFTEAQLARADLTGAEARSANFNSADLKWALLHHTDLTKASLINSDAVDALFSKAVMKYANLTEATLIRANFFGANLENANLSRSILGETIFANNDLSRTTGLETVVHSDPSSVDVSTITRSHGNIPESFLRGTGIPETFIQSFKSLSSALSPIEFYSCFISYSAHDQPLAERLYSDLQNAGVRCWFAPESLQIGDAFKTRIEEAIRVYDKLVVILSGESINSEWIAAEVEMALEKEKSKPGLTVLFPVRVDDAILQTNRAWAGHLRRTRHIGDFTRWGEYGVYKSAIARLIRDLTLERAMELRQSR